MLKGNHFINLRTCQNVSIERLLRDKIDWNSGQICLNFYCLIDFRVVINRKERSIDCTSALMFVLSTLWLSRVYAILNCKQCHKNFNEWCLQFNVCLLSLLTFRMVLMTLMLASMKVYFSISFVCRMTHMDDQKCYWMLIKMEKS